MKLLPTISTFLTVSLTAVLASKVGASDVDNAASHIRRRALSETVVSATNIPEGEPVKCLEVDPVTVFRYEGGVLRQYPNQFIAMTYNHDYDEEILTYKNCAEFFKFGPPMEINLEEGRNIICVGREPFIFRWTEKQLRHYPDVMVAASWSPTWDQLLRFDCDDYNLEFGPEMEMNFPDEGDVIICLEDESKVYQWNSGKLHHYVNGGVATSWDANWRRHAVRRLCAPFDFGEPYTTTEH